MKGKMNSDIKVEGSGGDEKVREWEMLEKVYLLKKKVNVKKNYRKIGKKNDNDVDADVTQLERGNHKCYASTFKYIWI